MDASLLNLLGQFASVFAAVAAAVPFVAAMQGWIKRGIGSRRELKRRLTRMTVGVTSDYVRSLFGVPVMQRPAPGVDGATDYYFMTNHAWIVARVRDGAVDSWSVTVTDFKFKMKISDLTRGLVEGVLGHSPFLDVVKKPSGVMEEPGGVDYSYAESTYFGRPSGYQTFVFMYNMEGIGNYRPSGDNIVIDGTFLGGTQMGGGLTKLEETRKETTVNTFFVCGPSTEILSGGAGMWPVVHRDGVAPLWGAPAERKKRLRKKMSRRQRLQQMLTASKSALNNTSASSTLLR